MSDSVRILLVEDELALAAELVQALEREHWPVDHVANLADAFEAVIQSNYRAILLDRRLPDGDGIALVAAARTRPLPPAIIFLTARDELADRIEGLDAGADDYLVKPFAMSELLARLRAACRRTPTPALEPPVEVGLVSYDFQSREAWVGGRAFNLPRRERALLERLIARAGRVVQRAQLENDIYGFGADVSPNALETLVSRLRRRLDEAEAEVHLRTVRGVGYMLESC